MNICFFFFNKRKCDVTCDGDYNPEPPVQPGWNLPIAEDWKRPHISLNLHPQEAGVAPYITMIFIILPAGLHGEDWNHSAGEVACETWEITEDQHKRIYTDNIIRIVSFVYF